MEKEQAFIFMGCKHCGKSTHGKALAEKLCVNFFDVDNVIEENVSMNLREFYCRNGKEAFKKAELEACKKIVTEENNNFFMGDGQLKGPGKKAVVISTGGGICDNEEAVDFLKTAFDKNGKFVFLCLDITYSVERIMENVILNEDGTFSGIPAYVTSENPKTTDDVRNILTKKFNNRTEKYKKLADIIINIKNAPIDENFNIIYGALNI